MSDQDVSATVEPQRSSRFSPIAVVLILVALAGAFVSANYSRKLSGLLREQNDFEELYGELKVDNPSQVAIVAVPPTAAELPVWISSEDLYIFRIYIPANYGISFSTITGKIASDSPLSNASGGGSSHGADPEAKEFQLIVSTSKEDGRLKVNLLSDSGSTNLSLPKELSAASPNDLVLETIVKPGDPMRTFDADEAICIWRLRSKTPSKKMLNDTKLYPSCVIYLYETAKRNAFQRWARGASSSMDD